MVIYIEFHLSHFKSDVLNVHIREVSRKWCVLTPQTVSRYLHKYKHTHTHGRRTRGGCGCFNTHTFSAVFSIVKHKHLITVSQFLWPLCVCSLMCLFSPPSPVAASNMTPALGLTG